MRGADRERDSDRAMSQPISIDAAIPAANMPHVHAMRAMAADADEVSWTLTPLGDSANAESVLPGISTSWVTRFSPGIRIR